MPNHSLTGSKKKIREAQRVAALKKRLGLIYEYAQQVASEDEFDAFLRHVDDDEMRAAVKNLCEPLVRFKYRKILLAGTEGATAPEKATNRLVVLQ